LLILETRTSYIPSFKHLCSREFFFGYCASQCGNRRRGEGPDWAFRGCATAATHLRYRGQATYLCVLNCDSGTPQLPLMGGRRCTCGVRGSRWAGFRTVGSLRRGSPNFRTTERCLFFVWEHKAIYCRSFCFETLNVFSIAEFDDLHRSDICYRKIDLRH
jgi:hypothetical protein